MSQEIKMFRITVEIEGKETFKEIREYTNTTLATVVRVQDKLNKADQILIEEQKKQLGIR